MSAGRQQVWVSLPVDVDEGQRPPRLDDGDSYLVRLSDGSVVWALYVVSHGSHFERIEDRGDESTGEVLSDVQAVMVSGYGRGVAGPIIARALTDRVVAGVLARIPVAMVRAKQIIERGQDEPVTSDTRRSEVA